jgi:hypothetical protein
MRATHTLPRRSARRPASGLITVSNPAAIRKTPPIATADAPSSSSRSAPRTPITPKPRDGTTISQMPARTRLLRIARPSRRGSCWSPAGGAGVRAASQASTAETTATPENVASVPATLASEPSAGPSSAPKIAAPSALPMSSARRSRGAAAINQASPPAHRPPPPAPWAKRAVQSSHTESAKPKTMLDTARTPSPSRTVGRTPQRAASHPPGSDPTSAPTA